MWQDRAQGNPDGVWNHFGMDGGAAHGTPSGEGAASMKSAPEMDAQHHRYLDNQFRVSQNPAFQSMPTSMNDPAYTPQALEQRAQHYQHPNVAGYLEGGCAPSTRVTGAQILQEGWGAQAPPSTSEVGEMFLPALLEGRRS